MKNIILIIASIILLGACTERIDIKLDSTYQRLIVEGYVTTDTGTQWVRLTRSSDYYSGKPVEPVNKATVKISDGNESILLQENPEKPGYYETGPDFYGVPGRTYQLDITLAEEIGGYKDYSASSELHPVASIDSIQVVYNDQWNIYEIQIFALEPPTTDFYMFQVIKNQDLISDTITKVWTSDDRYFNGNYTNGALVGFLNPDNPREVLNPGDTVTLKMSEITKEFYNFIVELQDQTSQYRNPLFSGPPANVVPNIPNAFGFFTAYSSTYSSTIFK